jgi:hypothetical protein
MQRSFFGPGQSLATDGTALTLAIMTMMAMSALAASLILFPIMEKGTHSKHVQFVSGASDKVCVSTWLYQSRMSLLSG